MAVYTHREQGKRNENNFEMKDFIRYKHAIN